MLKKEKEKIGKDWKKEDRETNETEKRNILRRCSENRIGKQQRRQHKVEKDSEEVEQKEKTKKEF